MSPGAQRTLHDFSRFAGNLGASVHFEDLLWHGVDELPSSIRGAYPGLTDWRGIAALKDSLRNYVQLPSQARVLFASRSAQLMKLAATLLCRPCRNILVTDLGWQPYHDILASECQRTNRRMTLARLHDRIVSDQMDANDVAEWLSEVYQKNGCDGLFLPVVSNLGIRLPIKQITEAIVRSAKVRFVVLDGAQDIGHTQPPHAAEFADFYLAGTHKWLGSHLPLGLAFHCPARSWGPVDAILHDNLAYGLIDDPLLKYAADAGNQSGETVNFSPLFAAHGAVGDAAVVDAESEAPFAVRLRNVDAVAEAASSAKWHPRLPHSSLRGGILLLQAQPGKARSLSPEALRSKFHRFGISLTAYEQGVARLSMPAVALDPTELDWLRAAFQDVA